MSAGGAVVSRARHAGRLGLAVPLVLALLPACESERLVLITVERGGDLSTDFQIATLEARTSFTHYAPGRHENVAGDAASTTFPVTLGLYLKERSGSMDLQVFAYGPGGGPVASGQRAGFMLNGLEQQFFSQELFLHPCGGPATEDQPPCQMFPHPDGGDAATDTEVGAGADAETDAHAGREVGDDGDAGTGAGPFDAGPIPQACTDYCTAVVAACSMLFSGQQQQCERSCAAADLMPDGLACRMDILRAAPYANQCVDASLVGTPCSPMGGCSVYCTLGASVCRDAVFSSPACGSLCSVLPVGNAESPRGNNSLLCRVSWLQSALDDPTLCAHALPAGPCQAQ